MRLNCLSCYLLAGHIMNALLYLLVCNTYHNSYPVWYFGTESLFFSGSIISAMSAKRWIEKSSVYIHATFIFIRGIIYVLEYSRPSETFYLEKLIVISLTTIVFVCVLYFKSYFYGYFNEKL